MKSFTNLPPELYSSPPRDVRLSRAGRAVAVVAFLLCVGAPVAGVALRRVALRERVEQTALWQSGIMTNGTITRLKRESKDSKRASVYYQFEVNGRVIEDHAKLPIGAWKTLSTGRALPIRYLDTNPQVNLPDGAAPDIMPVALAYVLGAIMLLVGAICWLLLAAQRRLLSDGRQVMAVIKTVKKHRTQHGSYWNVKYEFSLLSGAMQTGMTQTRSPIDVGNSIAVVYDSDRPRRNRPYPLSLVRLADSD